MFYYDWVIIEPVRDKKSEGFGFFNPLLVCEYDQLQSLGVIGLIIGARVEIINQRTDRS